MSKPTIKTENNTNLPINIPNLPDTIANTDKLTTYEAAAVALKRQDPKITTAQIGRRLKTLGFSKNDKQIYRRLSKSDYLATELIAVENAHREHLVRSTYPLAEKVTERALKASDKRLSLKDKFSYVKLAYDKVHGETHRHVSQPAINVENIERLQVVIGNDLKESMKKDTVNTSK